MDEADLARSVLNGKRTHGRRRAWLKGGSSECAWVTARSGIAAGRFLVWVSVCCCGLIDSCRGADGPGRPVECEIAL